MTFTKVASFLFLAVLLGIFGLYFTHRVANAPVVSVGNVGVDAKDAQNASYKIDGKEVTLTDGLSSVPLAGTSATTTTVYFGNEAKGDLSGDGKEDIAFILTQSTGGSGTFYYLAIALRTDTGYKGSNTILLGDRIAPQTTEIKNGEVIVNYAIRAEGEPMSAKPTIGVSLYAKIVNGILVQTSAQ